MGFAGPGGNFLARYGAVTRLLRLRPNTPTTTGCPSLRPSSIILCRRFISSGCFSAGTSTTTFASGTGIYSRATFAKCCWTRGHFLGLICKGMLSKLWHGVIKKKSVTVHHGDPQGSLVGTGPPAVSGSAMILSRRGGTSEG